MSTEIRVDPQFLTNLARRVCKVSEDLRQYSAHDGEHNLESAPPVAGAYGDLSGRWDHERGGLADSLDKLAEVIVETRKAFVDADQELAQQLDSG